MHQQPLVRRPRILNRSRLLARLRLELLEDRNLLANGLWYAAFGGLVPSANLDDQAIAGNNLLLFAGLTSSQAHIIEALDLSGTFVINTPPSTTLTQLQTSLQTVPGFQFVSDYSPPSPSELRRGTPAAIRSEAIFGPFNYDAFLERERLGKHPNGGGLVDQGPAPTNVLGNNNTGASGTGQFTQSETAILAFGNTVLLGFNDSGSNAGGTNKFTGFSRSTDGGTTFVDGGTLPTNPVGDAGDPVLARHDATGRIYFSTLGFNAPSNIQMFRSDDNGVTWMPPVNATPGGSSEDKQWHTVDNYPGAGNGNVYVLSRRFGAGPGIYFFRSTDGGNTFGPNLGTLITTGQQGAFVAVGPDHAVYAFWYDSTLGNANGRILMRKSTDFGLTFGAPVVVTTGLMGGVNGDLGLTGIRQGTTVASGFRSNEFPHVSINPINGHLYATFANNPPGTDKADIFVAQSTDGGATWGAAIKVNDDLTTTDQWQPTITVSPDGSRLGVFYYSRQEDPVANNLFKFYGRIASISGPTLSFAPSFAISNTPSLPEFGRDSSVNSVYMGDYDYAVATPGFFHVVWADNRDDLPGGAGRKDPNVYYQKIPLGLAVTTTVPAVGSTVAAPPTVYTVNVTDAVNPATVDASDFRVNGIAANTVAYVPGTTTMTFTFTTSPVTAQGLQLMRIDAGAFTRAADGNPVIEFNGTFRFDTLVLQVTSTVPPNNGVFTLPGPFTYDVNFNEPVDPTTVQIGDLSLAGIAGAFVSAVTVLPGNTTARFTLAGITAEGALTASLGGGAVADVFGNPNLAFTGTYSVDIGTVAYPVPLAAKPPAGSLIYDPTAPGIIGIAGDTDNFTLNVDAGQTITIVMRPTTVTTLQPVVTLRDPSNAVIATATAPAVNQNAIVQTISTTTAGVYTITAGGAGTTIGNYVVQVTLNAAEELERNAGQATNNTAATAQNVNPSFLSLGGSLSRGAVTGTVATTTDLDFYSVSLTAGDTFTIALKGVSSTAVNAQLRDTNGTTILAGGVLGPTNLDRTLREFVVSATGTYFVVVSGTVAGATYNAVFTRNTAFDSELNDTFATAQNIHAADGVLGALSPAASGVVPSTLATVEGNSGNTFPFHLGSTGGPEQRYQQIYTGSQLGSGGVIDAIRFRRNTGQAAFSTTGINVEISLSHAATTFATMSSTFDANIGVGNTVVFSGLLNLSSSGIGTPNPFDIVIDVANTFTFNPALGDLLMQVKVFSSTAPSVFFDSATSAQQSVTRRLFASGNANATTGTLDATPQGLVTKFDLVGAASEEDWYSFAVNAGDALTLQSRTPADGPGEFVNTLNPRIELYNPSNVLVATGVVLPDGHNELISHTALATGLYRLRVVGEGSTGDYAVSIAGNTGTALPPFQVVTNTPANGATVLTAPTFTVDFNDSYLASSVQPTDLIIDGSLTATAIALVDGDTVTFTLPALANGMHTVALAAGSIVDVQNTPVLAFTSTFFIDGIAPRVTATSIAPGAILTPGSLSYQITFSEPMRVANILATGDFTLHGNFRQAVGVNYTPSSFSFNAAGTVLTLNYVNLPDDNYTLTLIAGTSGGTNFTDAAGNALDGEFTGTFPSGNGTAGGNFVIGFNMDPGTLAFPTPLVAEPPLGSLIYDPPTTGTIALAGDTDSFTIAVDAGQTITVLVTPNTAALQPAVQLLDPTNAVVGASSATAANRKAVIQTVATTSGLYTVTVNGVGGTTGLYTVRVILNAALEAESNDEPTNNTLASAEELASSFLGLQTTLASAQRGAALGATDNTSPTATAVTPSFTDISATGTVSTAVGDDSSQTLTAAQLAGFAFPFFGTTFTTIAFSTNGLITFPAGDTSFTNTDLSTSPAQAAIAVLWDDLFNPGAGTSQIYWQVIGSGASQQLIVQWNNVTQRGGVNQFTFQAILSANGNVQLNYGSQVTTANVVGSATVGVKAAGTVNPGRLLISFNQPQGTLVGPNLSTLISTPPPTPDYYKFTLTAGQLATIAVANQAAGNLTLELRDGSENVLATGVGGATNLNKVISNFLATTTGTYFVRITGDSQVPYSLVVNRDAALDTEANSTAATAQLLAGNRGTLGSAQDGTGTLSDFESGQQGYVINNNIRGTGNAAGLWNLSTRRGTQTGHSPVTSFYYGNPVTGNFDTGAANAGSITSAPITLGATGGNLSFNYVLQTEGNGSFDVASVQVSTNNFTTFTTLLTSTSAVQLPLTATWRAATASLAAFAGQTIQVRFLFDTVDSISNAFEGWYVDDVQVGVPLDVDWYSVTLAANQTVLQLDTITPADGPGQYVNALNPKIDLFDATGTVLIASGVVGSDGRNESLLATGLTPGTTYKVRVIGEGGTGGEYFVGTTSLRTPTPTALVDNNNFGFSTRGAWTTHSGGHLGSHRRIAGNGDGSLYAQWQYGANFVAGTTYEFFVTWVAAAGNATNARYKVFDGATQLATVFLDQTRTPNSVLVNGSLWQSLFLYTAPATGFRVIRVQLDNSGNGNLVADAIFDPPLGGAVVESVATPLAVPVQPVATRLANLDAVFAERGLFDLVGGLLASSDRRAMRGLAGRSETKVNEEFGTMPSDNLDVALGLFERRRERVEFGSRLRRGGAAWRLDFSAGLGEEPEAAFVSLAMAEEEPRRE